MRSTRRSARKPRAKGRRSPSIKKEQLDRICLSSRCITEIGSTNAYANVSSVLQKFARVEYWRRLAPYRSRHRLAHRARPAVGGAQAAAADVALLAHAGERACVRAERERKAHIRRCGGGVSHPPRAEARERHVHRRAAQAARGGRGARRKVPRAWPRAAPLPRPLRPPGSAPYVRR